MIYICKTPGDKFGCSTLVVPDDFNGEISSEWIKSDQETVDGLQAHTLCWNGDEIVPYEPTTDELAATAAQEQAAQVQERIARLKKQLADTDYQAIKYAEGEMSESEYAPIKAQRAEWRLQINELERR